MLEPLIPTSEGYIRVRHCVERHQLNVARQRFGKDMKVKLSNDQTTAGIHETEYTQLGRTDDNTMLLLQRFFYIFYF